MTSISSAPSWSSNSPLPWPPGRQPGSSLSVAGISSVRSERVGAASGVDSLTADLRAQANAAASFTQAASDLARIVEVAERAGVPGCAGLPGTLRTLDVVRVLALPPKEVLRLFRNLQDHATALGEALVDLQRQSGGIGHPAAPAPGSPESGGSPSSAP